MESSTYYYYEHEVLELFEQYFEVNEESGCWEWIGVLEKTGYGRFPLPHLHNLSAHRASYQIFKNEIPKGIHVCHKCDNPRCVNPDHLFLGTPNDNIQDMIRKGRNCRGEKVWSAKLNDEKAMAIFNDKRHPKYIAKDYGITEATVYSIRGKYTWKHIHK